MEKGSVDVLWGTKAIAAELGLGQRQAYYALERGLIPATKRGRRWVASRKILAEHFGRVLNKAAASIEARDGAEA